MSLLFYHASNKVAISFFKILCICSIFSSWCLNRWNYLQWLIMSYEMTKNLKVFILPCNLPWQTFQCWCLLAACGPHCNGILVCTLLISCINMAQIHDTALIADIIIMYKHEMVKLWLIHHSGWQRQVDPQWSSSNWSLTHKKLEMLVCIQHCSYWCPGAKSPGHQYSQCFVIVSYKNITII